MPRHRLRRRISFMPRITKFTPIAPFGASLLEEIILNLDELEALRLKDIENIDQEKAAEQMQISQPTFHRLILGARKKVADALVNNKQIKIQGGNYEMVEQLIKGAGRGIKAGAGAGRGRGAGAGRGRRDGFAAGPSGECACPKCGYRMPHQRGTPCYQQKCPKCGTSMTRG